MKKKYIIIGGQYDHYCYGIANTLTGAKRIASKNCEYWDNWQGWHVPAIYAIEDCYKEEEKYYPCSWAIPVCVGRLHGSRTVWEDHNA